MYCGHCAPCPKGIDVASVTKFLNLSVAQGEVPETVREHYTVLPHKSGECVAYGACEGRCPFGVPVIENMRRAAEVRSVTHRNIRRVLILSGQGVGMETQR